MGPLSNPKLVVDLARTDGKSKGGAGGSNVIAESRKTETNTALAMALAGPNSSSTGGLIAKLINEGDSNNSEDVQESEYEGEELGEETEVVSQTLGEQDSDCTPSVRQNANEGNSRTVRPSTTQEKGGKLEAKQPQIKQWASLFVGRRRRSEGPTLRKIDVGEGLVKLLVEYVEVELPNGKKHCQYIYYENLPKYCTNCAIMGHSVGSCKGLESIQEKKAMETKKQAMGQTAETGQEANKGEHSEWVTKKGRSVKGQVMNRDKNTIEISENMFKVLEATQEIEVQADVSEPGRSRIEDVQGRVQGSDEVPNNQAGSEIRGGKGVELSKETTTPEIGQTSSGLNQPGPSQEKIQGTEEMPTKKNRAQVVGEMYKQKADGELNTKGQQNPKIGLAAPQKKGMIQTARNQDVATANSRKYASQSQGAQINKGEEGKRRNERKKSEKSVGRRQLWDNLSKFNSTVDLPWLLMGDFNNVLNSEEKTNGLPVSPYEMRDFQRCCYELSISDLRHTGLHYTWTNNSVWSKLDRAMVNIRWVQEGLKAVANFGLPGKCSDHSPCVVTMFDIKDEGARPFKFFNMWAQHSDFLDIVSRVWRLQVHGTEMYKLCRKLKALKQPLKELNKLHFSHISPRAAAAEEDLLQVPANVA
ncbi:Ribosome-binding protein like [Actinidia chinensis var. chinensis]|uniref:Ribosome-binding protein like n=1 Tax=Actinidia chinensis var. chinensis TaxID=1590841 RepID=A0A2R6QYX6_ACTCC|nr:Ribosome-binding protein like [Actinidia chinensis var. chinensis]